MKNMIRLLQILSIIVIAYCGVAIGILAKKADIKTEKEVIVIVVEEEKEEIIKEMIVRLAGEQNFDVETALRIAECESQYGKYQINWEGSSAKGVYQFIDKTWENYCDGDVLNNEDNIKCFLKLYNKHTSWWKCK
jgi:hypothetical protein